MRSGESSVALLSEQIFELPRRVREECLKEGLDLYMGDLEDMLFDHCLTGKAKGVYARTLADKIGLGACYKRHEGDRVWWFDVYGVRGRHLFSFDGKEIFNLFRDYPWRLTSEQKEVFDKENPEWAEMREGGMIKKKITDKDMPGFVLYDRETRNRLNRYWEQEAAERG